MASRARRSSLVTAAGAVDRFEGPHAGCHLGNFPEVFSHLALINACVHPIPLGTSGLPPFDKYYQSDIMLIGDRVADTTASEEASR